MTGAIELKIATRNLISNLRRTLLTLFIIIIGLTAILFISGYINMVRVGFAQLLTETTYAHFRISKTGYIEQQDDFSMQYSLTPEEVAEIEDIMYDIEGFSFALPRSNLQGTIGNFQYTTLFRGYASDPYVEGLMSYGSIIEGEKLSLEDPSLVVIGTVMAEKIRASIGDSFTLITPNEGGGIEAANVTIGGIADFGPKELNETAMIVSNEIASLLYYTDNVQSVSIMLDEIDMIEEVFPTFLDRAKERGLDVEARIWSDLHPFYLSVIRDYTFQLKLIAGILLFVILLAVSNTIYMSIIERTPEIGTLRAIGISKLEIVRTILKEGLLISIVGILVAIFAVYGIEALLQIIHIELPPPPTLVEPIKLQIFLRIRDIVLYCFILGSTSTLGTLFPALKASNTNIIAAIRHA